MRTAFSFPSFLLLLRHCRTSTASARSKRALLNRMSGYSKKSCQNSASGWGSLEESIFLGSFGLRTSETFPKTAKGNTFIQNAPPTCFCGLIPWLLDIQSFPHFHTTVLVWRTSMQDGKGELLTFTVHDNFSQFCPIDRPDQIKLSWLEQTAWSSQFGWFWCTWGCAAENALHISLVDFGKWEVQTNIVKLKQSKQH